MRCIQRKIIVVDSFVPAMLLEDPEHPVEKARCFSLEDSWVENGVVRWNERQRDIEPVTLLISSESVIFSCSREATARFCDNSYLELSSSRNRLR